MKIIFFGTANEALPILEALRTEHEILSVVTAPDAPVGRKQDMSESPVSALATDLKLPVLKPETVKNNAEFINQLRVLGADIFVVVAYGKILPLELINLPQFKTINVHFAVLPKYRGPSPIQYALLNGDQQTGTSIFVLDEKVDNGPLIAQEIVNIDADDNYFTLSDKLARHSAKIINSTLAGYTSGKITPLPQDEAGATYSKIINKEDGKVNWQKTAQEIYNQFRAFYLWPGIWSTWKGQKIQLTECQPVDFPLPNGAQAGTILDQGVIICGQGTTLQVSRLKMAGKNETGILEFLNGYRDFVGSMLDV